jgi:hypothetical protein
MIDLENINDSVKEDIVSVTIWSNKLYEDNFSLLFSEAKILFERIKSSKHPITDEDLSWILTTLPLLLFEASEGISRFKLTEDVIKMRIKQKEVETIRTSTADKITHKKEEAAISVLGDKLLVSAYSAVVDRVRDEVSASQELIMGAKKIWDARRRTEQSNPVGLVTQSPMIDSSVRRLSGQGYGYEIDDGSEPRF